MSNKNILLTESIISNISDSRYNNPVETPKYTLTGFSIEESENSITNTQEEKRLQWLVNHQLEILSGTSIIEENFSSTCKGQNNGYILEDELIARILLINKNKIDIFVEDKNKNISGISSTEVAKIMSWDIISKYNKIINLSKKKTRNIKIHTLFFNEEKLLSVLIEGQKLNYEVIDFQNKNINKITIIKEKRLVINNSAEYADFAVFFNGLPFIVIEMKSGVVKGVSGVDSALKDYRRKRSYHNFIACIGTNVASTFLSTNPNFPDYFTWKNYDKTTENQDKKDFSNGLYDLLSEIVVSPKNMLFYFNSCVMLSEDGEYLKSARVQQYFTAKKIRRLMKTSDKPFIKHFQHHTRTGKSFTFKIISKMAWKEFNYKYKKVLFFTHDVSSVLESVKKEYKNLNFPNGEMQVINSIKEYSEIFSKPTMFGMYIVNMQKIPKSKKVIDGSSEIIILIDEVHTHQSSSEGTNDNETMADFRRKQFPNATQIAATATPTMKEVSDKKGKTKLINITEQLHGECIDKLTPSDALDLKLVTKLHYEKASYSGDKFDKMLNGLNEIEEEQEKNILQIVLIDNIEATMEHAKDNIIEKHDISQSTIDSFNGLDINKNNYLKIGAMGDKLSLDIKSAKEMDLLLENLQLSINKEIKTIKSQFKSMFEKKIWELSLRAKIEHQVIPKIEHQRDSKSKFYTPKSFYVVPPLIENGKTMLEVIKSMIQEEIDLNPNGYDKTQLNKKNNIYKGVRFGFDNDEDDTLKLNGDLGGKSNITKLFEVDEVESKSKGIVDKTKPVDVLILVKKKLMGYDNKNLTNVFLDKTIGLDNIKEMLQLSTRGTTKRVGKDMGILVDLTITDDNVLTYKRAFSIYDDSDGVDKFLFDEVEIKKTILLLEKSVLKIKNFFLKEVRFKKLKKSNVLDIKNIEKLFQFIQEKYWLFVGSKQKGSSAKSIEKYIDIMSEIEIHYKNLISPDYILVKDGSQKLQEEVLSIYRINSELLKDIKYKESQIYKRQYTNNDILEILENTFSIFGGLNEFVGKLGITFKQNAEVSAVNGYVSGDSKRNMGSKVASLLKDINKLTSVDSGSIRDSLEKIQMFLDTNQSPPLPDGDVDYLTQQVKKMKEERLNRINKEFGGNEYVFECFIALEDSFKEILKDGYYNILKLFSEDLSKRISKKVNSLSTELSTHDKIFSLLSKDGITFNKISDEAYNKLSDTERELLVDNYDALLGEPEGSIAKLESELMKELGNGVDIDIIDNKILNILGKHIK